MFLRFINNLKFHLKSNKLKWFVFGNESSDLDSIVSSLTYAYFKQDIIGNDIVVIPVCCISKDNLKLKKDVIKWLNLFEIDSDNDLIFLDDIKDFIFDDKINNMVKISLLDHHKPLLPIMAIHIREIIDHRTIVYNYPDGQLELCNIQLVGSCCTLISEYIIERSSLEERSTLLEMLRGVILLDTDCLTPDNGRTTNHDIIAVEKIESCLGISAETRQDVYKCLSEAKGDISGLSLDLMIRRDLKMLDFTWKDCSLKMAIPTLISVDVEELLAIADVDVQLTEILKDLSADIIIGITCGSMSCRRIGILIFSPDDELSNKIYGHSLLAENNLTLQPVTTTNKVKGLYQNDLGITRKLFIPIIESFFQRENEKQQINNCSADAQIGVSLTIKTVDFDFGADNENEGAPYSLNTPLRSYSGSPDNRKHDIMLPSLNNRYTQELVDRKRRIHRTSIGEDSYNYDDIKDVERPHDEDFSPQTFTPENSDDESMSDRISDSKTDNRNPLPLLKHYLTSEKQKRKIDKISEQIISLNSTAEPIAATKKSSNSDGTNVGILNDDTTINESMNIEQVDDIDETDFNILADKVHKKREKLHSTHLNSVASALVSDILKKSENAIYDEISAELMLNDWTDCYEDDERSQILSSFKCNDLTKVAELLTSSLIRDCLKTHENFILGNNDVNNNAKENEFSEVKSDPTMDGIGANDDNVSVNSLEEEVLDLDIGEHDCHLGNIVNEGNQTIVSSCVNLKSVEIVENSSFNLYRRISNNQMDFSDDEKQLLTTAGDWLPNEDVIYSDTEHDDNNDNHYFLPNDCVNNEASRKVIFPDKEIFMDASRFEVNTSTEISLNDLDNRPTPDLVTLDESDVNDIVETLSQSSSPNKNNVQTATDNPEEKKYCNLEGDVIGDSKFEKYKLAINDAGFYIDTTNNNERTQLITLSSGDLPDKSDENYQEIMQYIFDYTVCYLESIDSDYYTLVYFHCFGAQHKGPSLMWLHQSYQIVPYRLKKTLKHLYIVHPTIWVRAALFLSRFFINAKFYSKIQYITELEDLKNYVPTYGIRFPSDVLK